MRLWYLVLLLKLADIMCQADKAEKEKKKAEKAIKDLKIQ